MNKYTIITIIAIIAIVIPIVFSTSSVVGINQMEYRWNGPEEFNYFNMINHGEMEFCNTLPFWMSFDRFEVAAFYQSEILGVFTVLPVTMNPYSSTIEKGSFKSEEMSEAQHILMTFDFEFNGGTIRLDPNQFIIVINADTPILGVIPYTTTIQMSGFEFDQIMNSEDLFCN